MDANGEWLIRMNGITKIFLTEEVETHALSGVHLGVRKGEYVTIAGPSGCGKSTLLSMRTRCRRALMSSTERRRMDDGQAPENSIFHRRPAPA